MNIYQKLKSDIFNAASAIIDEISTNNNDYSKYHSVIQNTPIILETSKDLNNYDIATNIAMIMSKKVHQDAITLATLFKQHLSQNPYIEDIIIAHPGFINFVIVKQEWLDYLVNILNGRFKEEYTNIGKKQKVNIEYVSANPTGPLHIGHARSAVYGDVLATLLDSTGYQVTKEYYINDAGSQIDILTQSVYLRYKQAVTGIEVSIAEGLYPGEYLIPIGQKLADKYHDSLLNLDVNKYTPIIQKFAIDEILQLIKEDLHKIGIEYDVLFSEKTLHESGAIDRVVKLLESKGLIYVGELDPPKGLQHEQLNLQPKSQLLFKSTLLGDNQDRPLKKDNGSWSYFASDIAYAQNKINRGFDYVVFILGADHIGYVKRIQAIFDALTSDYARQVKLDIKICQLVNILAEGTVIKMSKRSGNFITIREVYDTVGKDVIRFFMLTRKNNATIDFDITKLQEQSRNNPVFYVQYAYVRAGSIIRNAHTNNNYAYQLFTAGDIDFNLLNNIEELNLIKSLATWSYIVESAARNFEPHRIAIYLQSIAYKFHALWNLIDYKFIIADNSKLTAARLALATAIRAIIGEGLKIIGVSCPEFM